MKLAVQHSTLHHSDKFIHSYVAFGRTTVTSHVTCEKKNRHPLASLRLHLICPRIIPNLTLQERFSLKKASHNGATRATDHGQPALLFHGPNSPLAPHTLNRLPESQRKSPTLSSCVALCRLTCQGAFWPRWPVSVGDCLAKRFSQRFPLFLPPPSIKSVWLWSAS